MPELEYTVQVVSDHRFPLPDARQMEQIVEDGLLRWAVQQRKVPVYVDIEVTNVSDDL